MSSSCWVYPDMNVALHESTVELCNRICERFTYQTIKKWQALAMQALLHGTDVVVSSGTGSGKSLVFQGLALSKKNAIVLVISPLISIMENQVIALI
jgi:superfamily II DNA helicase RecQ